MLTPIINFGTKLLIQSQTLMVQLLKFGMYKLYHATLDWAWVYFSMLRWMLICVTKRDPCEFSAILVRWKLSYPDSKFHGANMGPTWVLSAPDGPHVDPMNLAIREACYTLNYSLETE